MAVRLRHRKGRHRAFFVNFMKILVYERVPQRMDQMGLVSNFKAQVLDSLYEKGNFAAGEETLKCSWLSTLR